MGRFQIPPETCNCRGAEDDIDGAGVRTCMKTTLYMAYARQRPDRAIIRDEWN